MHPARNTPVAPRDERGTAMVAILGILSALVVLSVGVIQFARTEIQIADNSRTHTGALYVAEAGINEVIGRMGMSPGSFMEVNGDTIDPFIGDDGSGASVFLELTTVRFGPVRAGITHSADLDDTSLFLVVNPARIAWPGPIHRRGAVP